MTTYLLPQAAQFESAICEKNTHLLTLKNRAGMQVALCDYGARLVSVLVPDNKGNLIDIVLGFDSISNYLQAKNPYHGATIGRVCNRIHNAQFQLDNKIYTLAKNDNNNCIHGGIHGFHNKVWDRQVNFNKKVDFYYVSKDGEEGFPGELKVNVSYELSSDNEIIISFRAHTDKTTIINLTNHAYFNLNGEGEGDVLNHYVQILAEQFLPVDQNLIPLGHVQNVENTPFDFRKFKAIKRDLKHESEQLALTDGYDHSFINNSNPGEAIASVYSHQTGIRMDVFTDLPTVQFYTGNHLQDDRGKSHRNYQKHGGFCFEPQHYIDSPNQEQFPNIELHPGEEYRATIKYKFTIMK